MTRYYIFSTYTAIGNPNGYNTQTEATWYATQLALKGYQDVYITKTGNDGEMKHVATIN